MDDLSIKRKQIVERFPIIPFTGSSSLFSTVRRMRAEQAWGIPLQYRTGFAISTEHGVAANKLPETQWEQFLSQPLRRIGATLSRSVPTSHGNGCLAALMAKTLSALATICSRHGSLPVVYGVPARRSLHHPSARR